MQTVVYLQSKIDTFFLKE